MLVGAIILVNNDLSPNVLAALVRQLFIDDVVYAQEFDARVSEDSDYINDIRNNFERVLVIRDFSDLTNRNLMDVIIFVKAGLAAIEINKFGPPGKTFQVDKLTLNQLFAQ